MFTKLYYTKMDCPTMLVNGTYVAFTKIYWMKMDSLYLMLHILHSRSFTEQKWIAPTTGDFCPWKTIEKKLVQLLKWYVAPMKFYFHWSKPMKSNEWLPMKILWKFSSFGTGLKIWQFTWWKNFFNEFLWTKSAPSYVSSWDTTQRLFHFDS